LFRRLPLDGITIYWGNRSALQEVWFDPGNLIDKLTNRELSPGQTVMGVGIFEYTQNVTLSPQKNGPSLRVVLQDTIDDDPITVYIKKIDLSDDPLSSTSKTVLHVRPGTVDLSGVPVKAWSNSLWPKTGSL
jgi:hypothetical protein